MTVCTALMADLALVAGPISAGTADDSAIGLHVDVHALYAAVQGSDRHP